VTLSPTAIPTASPTSKAPTASSLSPTTKSPTAAPTVRTITESSAPTLVQNQPPTSSPHSSNVTSAGQTAGIASASVMLFVGGMIDVYVVRNPRTVEMFYPLSSSYYAMLIDMAQFFALTTVFNVNLDQFYAQFAAGFLWTDDIFPTVMRSVWTPDSSYSGTATTILNQVGIGGSQILASAVVIYLCIVGLPILILTLEFIFRIQFPRRIHWASIGIISRAHHLFGYTIPFAAGFEITNGSVIKMKITAVILIIVEVTAGLILWAWVRARSNDPTQQLDVSDVADRAQFGYFFIGLKKDQRHFFLFDYYRRMLVGAAFTVMIWDPVAQVIAISLIEFLYFLLLKMVKPMQDKTVQRNYGLSCCVRAVVPLIALIGASTVGGNIKGVPLAVSIILLLVFISMFVKIVTSLIRVAMGASTVNHESQRLNLPTKHNSGRKEPISNQEESRNGQPKDLAQEEEDEENAGADAALMNVPTVDYDPTEADSRISTATRTTIQVVAKPKRKH
jgi:hypothetical protein